MTVEGAERLKAELQRLKSVERPAVIQALADARSQGDLSENADYDAAKERQGFLEGRIAELEAKLAHAQVIDPAALEADGRVVFGATVEPKTTRPSASMAVGSMICACASFDSSSEMRPSMKPCRSFAAS